MRSRTFTVSMLILLVLPGSILIGGRDSPVVSEASASLTTTGPIIIEGDSQLASHPALRGGSGTSADPYVFSDYLIDSRTTKAGSIAVRNTTMNYIFKNITIYTSAPATAVSIRSLYSGSYRPILGTLQNITIIGTGRHLNMFVPNYFTVMDCTFVNYQTSGDLVYSYYGYYFYFLNNTFDAPKSRIFMDYYAYQYKFNRNHGDLGKFESVYFRYCDVSNNTLRMDSLSFYSGFASDIQGNELTSNLTSSDLVRIVDCHRIKVANNTLIGGKDAMYISHPNAYSPAYATYSSTTSMTIDHNNITRSQIGIEFHWATGYPATAYFSVHDNDFVRCIGYAIYIYQGGSPTTQITRNRFIENNGATGVFSAVNVQAKDQYGYLLWRGSYWSDWTYPDDNVDGYTDSSYKLSSGMGANDATPVTNPWFDFEKPALEILSPRGRFVPSSYLNLSWEGSDNLSGFDKVMIKQNNGVWVTIKDRNYCAFNIVKGQYTYLVKGYDRANLSTTIEMVLNLNETRSPIEIKNPKQSSYVSNVVHVGWKFYPGFVPMNMTSSVDDRLPTYISPYEDMILTLGEGSHSVVLEAFDFHGMKMGARVDFSVDTHAPYLSVKYPNQGSVLSNKIVYFNWTSYDISGIASTAVKIDSGKWVTPQGYYYSTPLLPDGVHRVTISVTDRAGYVTERTVDFTISKNTSLSITGPDMTGPTSKRQHIITWEYLSPFEVSSLEYILNDGFGTSISTDALACSLELEDQGRNTVRIEAKDPLGNMISDSLEITLDTTPPRPQLLMADPYYSKNATTLVSWTVAEDIGIDHFELMVDGIRIGGRITDRSYPVTLSEGTHVINLTAYDQAGNKGGDDMILIVDMTPPELTLVSPQGDVIDHSPFKFSWTGTDENGVLEYIFKLIDGSGNRTPSVGNDESTTLSMEEGQSTLILICRDHAMNEITITMTLFTDLYAPKVSFDLGSRVYTNRDSIDIEWKASDSAGISSQSIRIGSQVKALDTNANTYTYPAAEGSTSITITVSDLAGRNASDTIEVIGDRSIPALDKAGDPSVEGADALITWSVGNETGLRWGLYLDGVQIPVFDPSAGSYRFEGLPIGYHIANLTVTDLAGNSNAINWSFTITESEISGPDDAGSMLVPIIVAIAIIAMIIGAALYFFVMRGRKEQPAKGPSIPKKPEKLNLSAMRIPAARPAAPSAIEAPPIKDEHYIRPKAKAEKAPQKMEQTPQEPIPREDMQAPMPKAAPPVQEIPLSRPEVTLPQDAMQKEEVPEWDEDTHPEELSEFDEMEEWEEA
jgi:hypothetical protein